MYSLGKNIIATIGAKRNRAIPRAVPLIMGLFFIVTPLEICPFHIDGMICPFIDESEILLGIEELLEIGAKAQEIFLSFKIEIEF